MTTSTYTLTGAEIPPRPWTVPAYLPVLRRSLQRDGITIDHLTYFSSALRAWITARNRTGPLLVRRDPRDLSRVFVLDPLDGSYLEVPTRDLSRPAWWPTSRRSGCPSSVLRGVQAECCRRDATRPGRLSVAS